MRCSLQCQCLTLRPLEDANDSFYLNRLFTDWNKWSWQASLSVDHIKKQKRLYRHRLRMTENYKRFSLRYTNGALQRSLALILGIVSGVLPLVSEFCGSGSQMLQTRIPVRFPFVHVKFRSHLHLTALSFRGFVGFVLPMQNCSYNF